MMVTARAQGCEDVVHTYKKLFLEVLSVNIVSIMLKEHMGSSGSHFGPSSVTSTLPPRAARRPTVTTSQHFLGLHTLITFHHLLLFHF